MTVHRRKKNKRMRGAKTTHGYGAKKKHRGSGNKGGKGMAGSGKRADQKKTMILKVFGNEYFGRHGFKRPQKMLRKIKAINVEVLDKKIDYYLHEKLISKEGDFYVVDLSKLGYNKLLAKGNVKNKYKIKADYFSGLAVEKIKEAGGEIIDGNTK